MLYIIGCEKVNKDYKDYKSFCVNLLTNEAEIVMELICAKDNSLSLVCFKSVLKEPLVKLLENLGVIFIESGRVILNTPCVYDNEKKIIVLFTLREKEVEREEIEISPECFNFWGEESVFFYTCPACAFINVLINSRYCSNCGRKIKWV